MEQREREPSRQVGFDAWRFDFVKGYAAEFVGLYCKKSAPSWAVGELWGDMAYDDNGLSHNQDGHRQDAPQRSGGLRSVASDAVEASPDSGCSMGFVACCAPARGGVRETDNRRTCVLGFSWHRLMRGLLSVAPCDATKASLGIPEPFWGLILGRASQARGVKSGSLPLHARLLTTPLVTCWRQLLF